MTFESAIQTKEIYTKQEALIRMLVLGEKMTLFFNDNFDYYYLNGKFYRSGENVGEFTIEWNPNENYTEDWKTR